MQTPYFIKLNKENFIKRTSSYPKYKITLTFLVRFNRANKSMIRI